MLACAVAVVGSLLVGAPSASAATVGQAVIPNFGCSTAFSSAQTAVASGTSYPVPANGVLTSFSTRAYNPNAAGTTMKLVVFRADPETPGDFLVVGVSNVALTLPTSVPAADIVTPITPIAVLTGDVIGFFIGGDSISLCVQIGTTGDETGSVAGPEPTPGATVTTFDTLPARLSIAANLVPGACDTSLAPVGCWGFDELAGPTAFDLSGFGNHGTYLGGPTLGVPGVFGTAVTLDGVDDLVRVPDSASLDVGGSFSAEGWIKRASASKTHSMMLKGNNGLQLVVMNAGAGGQVFLRKTNVTTIARSVSAVPADGAYHHIVATVDGANSARIYIDGVENTVQVGTVQVIQNTAFPLVFGSANTTPATYDEFALYDDVLSPEEVAARFAAGAPTAPT